MPGYCPYSSWRNSRDDPWNNSSWKVSLNKKTDKQESISLRRCFFVVLAIKRASFAFYLSNLHPRFPKESFLSFSRENTPASTGGGMKAGLLSCFCKAEKENIFSYSKGLFFIYTYKYLWKEAPYVPHGKHRRACG